VISVVAVLYFLYTVSKKLPVALKISPTYYFLLNELELELKQNMFSAYAFGDLPILIDVVAFLMPGVHVKGPSGGFRFNRNS
jgi:hypothetical protein